MAEIKLRDVHKSFGKVEVIKGVNIEIEDSEFVVIVGPSGCGKSTLLRMIAGLEDITQGTLEIDGVRMNDRQPKDRGIAMVFQTYAIFPHMTVRENVAFGLTINKIDKATRNAKVDEAAGFSDGKSVGSSAVRTFWWSAPTCGNWPCNCSESGFSV